MLIEQIKPGIKGTLPLVASEPAWMSVFGPMGYVYTAPFVSWVDVFDCIGDCGHWSILRVDDEIKIFAPASFIDEPSFWGRA